MPVQNHRSRAMRVLVAGAILAAVSAVGLSSSSAAGILPTTTTVVTNKNPALEGDQVRLTATVKILGINLGPITPKGTVTFSNGTQTLGTAPVGACLILLKQCTASLEVDAPAVPGATLTARYNGDVLAKPSTGTVFQEVVAPRDDCNSANLSCSHDLESANGTARLRVEVPGDGEGTTYEIAISFTSDLMSCSRPNTGDIGVFNVTLDQEKTVRYDTYNQEAVTANQDPNRICWGSDQPFTTASGQPAQFVPTGIESGRYEGLLPMCSDGGPVPCVDGPSEFQPAQGENCDCDPRARLRTYIQAPAGDPQPGR